MGTKFRQPCPPRGAAIPGWHEYRHVKDACSFREHDVVVDDGLAVEIGDSEQHLRLQIDERDHAIVRREQFFFAALRAIAVRHDFVPSSSLRELGRVVGRAAGSTDTDRRIVLPVSGFARSDLIYERKTEQCPRQPTRSLHSTHYFRVARDSGAILQLTESAIASHHLNLVFALKEPLHRLIEDLVDVRIGERSRAHLQTVIHGCVKQIDSRF